MIQVFDADGKSVDNASIQIEGNMVHAGMTPVNGATQFNENGIYHVPFQFSMSGDWVLTVTATTPDGRQAKNDFPVTITETP